MTSVITRFAPSPTGDLHIGSLRTALYNYLFAKKNNGQFLLRIEDTDQARYQEGSVEQILAGLEWTGLKHDGKVVYQSHNLKKYQKYADQLLEQGHAYYCFCPSQTLDKMRHKQMQAGQAAKYDRRCLKLTQKEIEKKLKAGTPHVVRMKIPNIQTAFRQDPPKGGEKEKGEKLKFNDLIRGQVEFDLKELDDQVLLKSDNYPTYHLANVIDDHEMGITHIIRAEEWLPSTPKHVILYNMLGWDLPEFAHLSLILAPDKSKLSKRHGATSVLEFKKQGYLPEALINYIALLGWNPGDEREIFSLQELKKEFSLEKVHQAGAIFDKTKLDWMNGHYIRQLGTEKLAELCVPYLNTENTKARLDYIKKVVALEQERLKKLSDITEMTDYFFKQPEYDKKLLKWKKSNSATAKERLQFLIEELKKVPAENWTRSALEQFINQVIKAHNLGTGDTLWPMRAALTGREKSPGPFEVAEVLGKEEVLERLKRAVGKL